MCRPNMCIIYFGTLDNTFSFYIGSSDWHHEVFLLPRERRISVPWDSLSPSDQTFLRDKYPDAGQGAHPPSRQEDAHGKPV